MKRLLAVFAHPDDEAAISGTLAFYSKQGALVTLACATRGEAGEISDPSLATPDNLGQVREAELRCACDLLGISSLRLLDYCDSGMEGTPENSIPTAFIQADPEEVRYKFVKLFREVKPHVVITFEPQGWYGHPDHVMVSRYTTEAFHLAGDPVAFPEAGQPWQPQRLYYAAFLREYLKKLVDYGREQGKDVSNFDNSMLDEPDPLSGQVTHVMDVREFLEIKRTVVYCHRTQFDEDSIFSDIPAEVARDLWGNEYFIQAEPPVEAERAPLPDLFSGIFVSQHE